MAAHVGPAPWSSGFHRVTKNLAKEKGGVDWTWRQYRETGWDQQPDKPKMKRVTLASGITVKIPDADYEEFIGHQRPDTNLDPDSQIGKYVDNALNSGKKLYWTDAGDGHISEFDYSMTYQLLRVYFALGDIVVYFRVPKEVYSELAHLASSGGMMPGVDGKPRHLVGIRFWDIIRIRGQRVGSRYRFEYVATGLRTGTQFEQDVTAEAKESSVDKTAKMHDTSEQLYDGYAKNFLTGDRLNAYNKLKDVTEKASYLRKAGIL